jgi:hypothetical protein
MKPNIGIRILDKRTESHKKLKSQEMQTWARRIIEFSPFNPTEDCGDLGAHPNHLKQTRVIDTSMRERSDAESLKPLQLHGVGDEDILTGHGRWHLLGCKAMMRP